MAPKINDEIKYKTPDIKTTKGNKLTRIRIMV